jgi:hypothetical protein
MKKVSLLTSLFVLFFLVTGVAQKESKPSNSSSAPTPSSQIVKPEMKSAKDVQDVRARQSYNTTLPPDPNTCGLAEPIRFNPDSLRLKKNVRNKDYDMVADTVVLFRDVNSNHWLFIDIIKYYGFNSLYRVSHGFNASKDEDINRHFPPFTYFLKDGYSPTGNMPNEEKILGMTKFDIDPNTIKATRESGYTLITDDKKFNWKFESESQARQAVCVIKQYGFTKLCYLRGLNKIFLKK